MDLDNIPRWADGAGQVHQLQRHRRIVPGSLQRRSSRSTAVSTNSGTHSRRRCRRRRRRPRPARLRCSRRRRLRGFRIRGRGRSWGTIMAAAMRSAATTQTVATRGSPDSNHPATPAPGDPDERQLENRRPALPADDRRGRGDWPRCGSHATGRPRRASVERTSPNQQLLIVSGCNSSN
jgi:hypothetical protein